MNVNDHRQLEAEIQGLTAADQLKRLQKAAIDQGVPLSDVNRHIMEVWGGFISQEVKALILNMDKKPGGVATLLASGEIPVAETPTPATPAESSSPQAEKVIEGPVIEDQVDVVNIRERMRKIRQEAGVSQESELGAEAGADKPEIATQTAEKKEQTTTGQTQDSDGGVKNRLLLDDENVYGYEPSRAVASGMSSLAEGGDVEESKTWQAVWLQRLSEMWGSVQKLFSQKQ